MSFPSIQPSFDRLYTNNNSASFVDRNVYARLESLKIAGQEVWQFIVNIGESIKNLIGTTIRLPVKGAKWLLPNCGLVQRFHDWLPSCLELRNTATRVGKAVIGVFSSLLLGVIVNPTWNHAVHVKAGIIAAPAGGAGAGAGAAAVV